MKAFLTYPSYRIISDKEGNKKAQVLLYGRLENGESFVTINDFQPYFWIKKEDKKKAEDILKEAGTQGITIKSTDYKNFDDQPMSKVTLNIPKEVPELKKIFTDKNIVCYEADIRFSYRFMFDHNIKGALEIIGTSRKPKEGEFSVDAVFENPEIKSTQHWPKLNTLSIDIETDMKASKVFAISLYSDKIKKVLLLKKEGSFKDADTFATEKELLEAFKRFIIQLDPDVITGWNLIDFDFMVLKKLFQKHGIPFTLGRTNQECTLRLTESFFTSSSANFPGRAVIDALHLMKVSFIRLDDYKLNTAAKTILGEEKLITSDDRGKEIEELYEKDPQKLVDYNLKDSKLVIDILEKSKILELSIRRAILTGMQIDRVNASIASLDSLYLRELKERKIIAPSTYTNDRDERIKGGFVMASKPGIYEGIIVLDFKSLYPSIIRTFNIDPYSFVPIEKYEKLPEKERQELIEAPNKAHFKNQDGILPIIIKSLWKQRDIAKKNKDQLASQAIKITMNSFFGCLANPTCRFYSLEIANGITHFGQFLNKLTARKVEEKGYEVIYGDSVGKDTEVIVRQNKIIKFIRIDSIFKKVDKRTKEGKEYNFKKKIEVLTLDEKGKSVFKNIKYVMRHKGNKKIYRVYFTNVWYIDVTEDHSLIGYINKQKNSTLNDLDRLVPTKPKDIGDKAKTIVTIKNIPQKKIDSKNYPKQLYEFLGLFVGDGSFYTQKEKNYYLYIAGGLDSKEIITKVLTPLKEKKFIRNYWEKNKGDITINGLNLLNIVNKKCRKNGKKILPDFMFEETEENICSFLRGIFSADGTVIIRNGKPIIRFTNTDMSIISSVIKLLHFVGISNSLFSETKNNKYLKKKSNTVSKHILVKNSCLFYKKIGFMLKRKNNRLTLLSKDPKHKRTIKNFDFDLTRVKKIEKIDYKDYVYDIEVDETHRFFANNVLVHNTDSIFINTKTVDLKLAAKIGKELESYINEFYKNYVKENYNRASALELEFEKSFKKFLMPKVRGSETGAKKRYAGLIENNGKEEITITGLEFVRRDWTDLSKEFQMQLLENIFHDKPIEGYIKQFVDDLKSGKLDKLLVYKKAIRKSVSEYTKTTPPHIKAARLLGRENPGIIEYIMTLNGPEPIEKTSSPLDYDHYIEKQVKPIADAILSFQDKSFDDITAKHKQTDLSSWG